MDNYTKKEEVLINSITDPDLRVSLTRIRQAVRNIWGNDAPRIIHNYTDHGFDHCLRLVDNANKLLQFNDGRVLTEREMYMLLAGIYLHDIGMQCDVVKFTAIRELAEEKYRASFDIEFTAQNAYRYSLEEQNAIRNNHHFLTAAWIDYAWDAGGTVLERAAKTIPHDMVGDLIDVCLYHTKLSINDCSRTFFNRSGRKQFIAALLRFSDELDIDNKRVLIETVKNFSIDPQNSIYWWLHNNSRVIFGKYAILITVWLSPEDAKNYESLVYNLFINEFQTKNRAVMEILRSNDLHVVIDADSGVVVLDREEPLPLEIVQLLSTMQKKSDSLTSLSDEIRTWLRAFGYEISSFRRYNENTIEMKASVGLGLFKQLVLVRCVDGEITLTDCEELNSFLDRNTPYGWLISDKRVSTRAKDYSTTNDAIRVFNLTSFLCDIIWGEYFGSLEQMVKSDLIPELYVDLACYKQDMDDGNDDVDLDIYSSLDEYIDSWLNERSKMHISVLGDFGSGKTWFCRHYAYRQMLRYLGNPNVHRIPLLLTLRLFTKSLNVQELITNAFLKQYKLPIIGNPFDVFQEINRLGKLLLILDGFDEMASKVDYQTVVDNFWQLATLVTEGSKVILTSRREYFRWAKESQKILSGEELGRETIELQSPKFEVLYLKPLDDARIREIIMKRLGESKGSYIADHILSTPSLSDMARKPVLVELLLAALDDRSVDILKNPVQVYLYSTNKLLLRNIDTKRTFTSTKDKLFFLCELSWEMVRTNELRIHYKAIPDRIKRYFGEKIKGQHELDNWDFDLRNQTLLHNDTMGYYQFAHKSLAEFFVALKFAAELGCLSNTAQIYCEENGEPCEIPFNKKDATMLVDAFGVLSLTDKNMKSVRSLLLDLLGESARTMLWDIINWTKGKTQDYVKYVGGNAATLLLSLGESFANSDIEKTVLMGADMSGTNLHHTNFKEAYLNESNFSGADLSKAILIDASIERSDLSGANLTEAYLIGTNLSLSNLSRAIFSNAKFTLSEDDLLELNLEEGLIWEKANFSKSNLSLTYLSGIDLTETDLSDAILAGANLSSVNLTRAFLRAVDFSGANLKRANFHKAIFVNTNLIGVNLQDAYLKGANLEEANMKGANLAGAVLIEANLKNTNLWGANLQKTELTGANLLGVDLSNAKL